MVKRADADDDSVTSVEQHDVPKNDIFRQLFNEKGLLPESDSKQESQSHPSLETEDNIHPTAVDASFDPTLTRILSKVEGTTLQSKLERIAGRVDLINDEEIEAAQKITLNNRRVHTISQ